MIYNTPITSDPKHPCLYVDFACHYCFYGGHLLALPYSTYREEDSLVSLYAMKPESFSFPLLFLTESEELSLFLCILYNKERFGIYVPPSLPVTLR